MLNLTCLAPQKNLSLQGFFENLFSFELLGIRDNMYKTCFSYTHI